MTGATQATGLFSSMASAYLKGKSAKDTIEAQNALNEQMWMESVQLLRDQLTIAYNRTQTGLSEINRDKIAKSIATRRAGIKARGDVSVKAAQLGISGKRGVKSLTRDVTRQEADVISDINISTEIELINTVNAFNDSAKQAIANLNSHAPVDAASPSTFNIMLGSIGSGMDYYNKLSKAQQTDLKSNFNWKTNTSLRVPVNSGYTPSF